MPWMSAYIFLPLRSGALERYRDGDRQLADFVEAESRGMSSEAFARFMHEIQDRIGKCIAKS